SLEVLPAATDRPPARSSPCLLDEAVTTSASAALPRRSSIVIPSSSGGCTTSHWPTAARQPPNLRPRRNLAPLACRHEPPRDRDRTGATGAQGVPGPPGPPGPARSTIRALTRDPAAGAGLAVPPQRARYGCQRELEPGGAARRGPRDRVAVAADQLRTSSRSHTRLMAGAPRIRGDGPRSGRCRRCRDQPGRVRAPRLAPRAGRRLVPHGAVATRLAAAPVRRTPGRGRGRPLRRRHGTARLGDGRRRPGSGRAGRPGRRPPAALQRSGLRVGRAVMTAHVVTGSGTVTLPVAGVPTRAAPVRLVAAAALSAVLAAVASRPWGLGTL